MARDFKDLLAAPLAGSHADPQFRTEMQRLFIERMNVHDEGEPHRPACCVAHELISPLDRHFQVDMILAHRLHPLSSLRRRLTGKGHGADSAKSSSPPFNWNRGVKNLLASPAPTGK